MAEYKVLALPVDGRPVTREQVQMVARIAGCELLCPPVEALGHFRDAADRENLTRWIEHHAPEVDGFIFSLDMLVYGGLVPSRFIEDDQHSLIDRLALLNDLKRRYPDKPMYGFCATMRMSNNNENEEEKLYWSDYGTDIWAWSFHADRFACTGEVADRNKAEAAKERIPLSLQQDYIDTRARNFAVTGEVLNLVAQGVIDRLILPQDDTAEYGFNIAERRQLQQQVSERNLEERVLIYPGADEVIYTLLVHQLQNLQLKKQDRGVNSEVQPLRVALRPHHRAALQKMVARYEDRPVMESIRCQINAAGARLVEDASMADVVVAVHCRGSVQGDWAMQYPLEQDLGVDPGWVAQLRQDLEERGQPLALLDLAYANGGDPDLIAALSPCQAVARENSDNTGLGALAAYSGWNTASNSIGSLIAQLCAVQLCPQDSASRVHNRHLLATRLLDDYLYQSRLRQTLRAQQGERQLADGNVSVLEESYLPVARQWLREQGFAEISLNSVYFPWKRSFEVGLCTAVHACAPKSVGEETT